MADRLLLNIAENDSWFTELMDADFPVRYVSLPEGNQSQIGWSNNETPIGITVLGLAKLGLANHNKDNTA